jgi:hypothetical protein
MKPPNSLLLSMIAAMGLSFSASGALAGEPDTALSEKNNNKQTESRHHGDKSYPPQAMSHPYPLPVIRYPLPVTVTHSPIPDTRYPKTLRY